MSNTIDELTAALQKTYDQIDIIFTMNNSLDDADIADGGGSPEAQAEYQTQLRQQKLIGEEIDRRHVMDMLK